MPQPILIHWALLGYLVLVWGFAFAAIAIALESFHPFFIVWCRLWMGAIVMWVVW
ncbi:MAG: EamA/RhaT family transporter, partial [Gammaproteobacteria bacterium]|nr:EamA/RhaT family transporter [Gammaproteobacteria bacterium]